MCFSFEISIGTFLFSWGISLYLLNKGLSKQQKQKVIPLILSAQILYNVFVLNNNKNQFITILIFSGILYMFYRFNGYSKSLCNNKFSSPIWGSKELTLWELLLFALIVTYPNYNLLITFLIILLAIKIFVGGAYGSLWCAISNIVALYYLYKY